MHRNQTKMEKDKTINTKIKGKESFKRQEKNQKTPEGPSSVEYIKAEMQASIEREHEHSWALLVNLAKRWGKRKRRKKYSLYLSTINNPE